mmetsp:Transcript_31897/g.51502  ORF Transcript_31897/g.51502 Transcript_31897/m.51502 type:complete len:474 (+) Transcript_31897:49-1470(+)
MPSVEAYKGPPDDFLAPPSKHADEFIPSFERASASYTCCDERFIVREKSFTQQYAGLYFSRLLQMRPALERAAEKKWIQGKGASAPKLLSKVLDIRENQNSIIVGTLYKEMSLKPSILKQLARERSFEVAPALAKYISEDDSVVLEDEYGRVKLTGAALDVNSLVTGLVVAFRGSGQSGGDFLVEDICFGGLPPQPSLPEDSSEDVTVAIVSGLKFGEPDRDLLPIQLLVDYLTGYLGSASEQEMCKRIVRFVMAGEAVVLGEDMGEGTEGPAWKRNNATSKRAQAMATGPVKEFEMFLSQLCASLPVDYMPGPGDPSNVALPQQPVNRALVPLASRYSTYTPVTNPHEFEVNGKIFYGVSGQTLDDIDKYSTSESRLDLLERTLNWQHTAPTAPDTLSCYPFVDKDPFVLRRCPHIYFAGNQQEFASKTITGPDGQTATLILVPSFVTTSTLVLVNLRTLEATSITFSGYKS